MAVCEPQPPDAPAQAEAQLSLAVVNAPALRCPQVVVLPLQPRQPFWLQGPQLRRSFLGKRQEIANVPLAAAQPVAPGTEAFQRVLADRLQQSEADLAGIAVQLAEQALVDQCGDSVHYVDPELSVAVCDGLGSVQREAAHEHGQPLEQPLLGGCQQLITPGDRAAQGLMPDGDIAR